MLIKSRKKETITNKKRVSDGCKINKHGSS